jgi:hypothetical protein
MENRAHLRLAPELVRQDRMLAIYRGFFHLACLLITLRYL